MKNEMTLKEFINGLFENNITIKNLGVGAKLAEKMMELEAIGNWINLMYGVELDIKVRPAERKEGRYYGKSIIESIK